MMSLRFVSVISMLFVSLNLLAVGPDTIIQKVNLEDADIRQVVDLVRHETKSSIWLNCNKSYIATLPRINMNFTHIPGREVLRYACIACGLYFDINERGVMIVEKTQSLRTEFFKLDVLGKEATPEALKSYFSSGGMRFPEGSRMLYNRKSNTLSVTNTVENLRRARLIIGVPPKNRRYPRIYLQYSGYEVDNPRIINKLRICKLGNVSFDDIKLADLLLYLHRRTMESDPEKTGVNFFIAPLPEGYETTLNVNFTDATAMDVLISACKACGLEFSYDDFAVVIRKTDKNPLPAKEGSTDEIPGENVKSKSRFGGLGDEEKEDPFAR